MKNNILIFLLFFVCACEPRVDLHGNASITENIDKFVIDKTTASDVYALCGSPSLRKDNLTWIYISWKAEDISFKEVVVKDKLVVRMKFDESGVLKSIERINQDIDTKTPIVVNDEDIRLITEKEAESIVKSRE